MKTLFVTISRHDYSRQLIKATYMLNITFLWNAVITYLSDYTM